MQIDHLQMTLRQNKSEIDALFLAHEEHEGDFSESLITLEAKGRADDVLLTQVLNQVEVAFALPGVKANRVIPMAAKSIAPSRIHVIEWQAIERDDAYDINEDDLKVISQTTYQSFHQSLELVNNAAGIFSLLTNTCSTPL